MIKNFRLYDITCLETNKKGVIELNKKKRNYLKIWEIKRTPFINAMELNTVRPSTLSYITRNDEVSIVNYNNDDKIGYIKLSAYDSDYVLPTSLYDYDNFRSGKSNISKDKYNFLNILFSKIGNNVNVESYVNEISNDNLKYKHGKDLIENIPVKFIKVVF